CVVKGGPLSKSVRVVACKRCHGSAECSPNGRLPQVALVVGPRAIRPPATDAEEVDPGAEHQLSDDPSGGWSIPSGPPRARPGSQSADSLLDLDRRTPVEDARARAEPARAERL